MAESVVYLANKARRRTEAMVRAGVLRWCDVCGRPFRPYSPQNVYCGFKCRQEANRYRARMRMKERYARRPNGMADIEV